MVDDANAGRRLSAHRPTVNAMNIRERMALSLAATPFPSARSREAEALWQVGLTPPSYHALVLRVLDREDAEREMPAEVHRLRRLREKRAAGRSAR